MGLHDAVETFGAGAERTKYREKIKVDEELAADQSQEVVERMAAAMRCPKNNIRMVLADIKFDELRGKDPHKPEGEKEEEKKQKKTEKIKNKLFHHDTHSDNVEEPMTGFTEENEQDK
eukprot:CAMPEP_0206188092 /NCGR_PEP_ID=MMETSP0166-20121206/3382_1 /ASSEMBLY_ACC=CAM_ASM_000260 /TAXON_ID=95228 /ORGANISM="Vannella robusta, Strain DIVA3 518/3/11/1/6" /LENGTH=117 /DNA_ID=CAMNT_0053603781 /DNA_START=779 /DNA_END=1132 /DNA_ORIENTATION=+